MLSVQTNVSAISAQRNLGATSDALGTAMERLSSGFRINRAADDAAGLAVSEKLKAQIGGLNQASRNSQDGISMIQTAEGALDEVQSMMQRMRDLAVQASSDTNSQTERDNINLELGQLGQEINSISQRTKFNGQSMLSGSLVKSQATVASVTGLTELSTGATVGATVVGSISVDGAQAGKAFALTATAASGTTPAQATLTMVDTNGAAIKITDQAGQTHDVKQTVDIDAVAAGGAETLAFTNLGVSVTLTSVAGETADNIATGIAGATASIDTMTGSGTATLQTGSMQGDTQAASRLHRRGEGTGRAQARLAGLPLRCLADAYWSLEARALSARICANGCWPTGTKSCAWTTSSPAPTPTSRTCASTRASSCSATTCRRR